MQVRCQGLQGSLLAVLGATSGAETVNFFDSVSFGIVKMLPETKSKRPTPMLDSGVGSSFRLRF